MLRILLEAADQSQEHDWAKAFAEAGIGYAILVLAEAIEKAIEKKENKDKKEIEP